jgi:hypothetical protein
MAESRCRDDTADDLVVPLERDQRRPDGNTAREVLRPVDRIDDPADGAAVVAFLLPGDSLARTTGGDVLPKRALDRRSASVTGVRSGFVSTSRSSARKRGTLSESATSASSRAKARSEMPRGYCAASVR